jgi:hypothetical protein
MIASKDRAHRLRAEQTDHLDFELRTWQDQQGVMWGCLIHVELRRHSDRRKRRYEIRCVLVRPIPS